MVKHLNPTVRSEDIAARAVLSEHIAYAAVLSGHIASGHVGSAHLAAASVLSGHIASGQVGSAHLAPASVLSGHIGAGAVLSGSIASGQVCVKHIYARGGFISSASDTLVFTHDLGVEPAPEDVNIVPAANASYWLDAVTASTVTIKSSVSGVGCYVKVFAP